MLSVIRPLNVLLAGATVLLGVWLTSGSLQTWRTAVAVFIVMLFTAAGNIMNDICDLTSDRINQPQRPLPSGRISLFTARCAYLVGFGGGILLSLYRELYWIALPALLLIIWYNRQLQKTAVAGNLVVSLLTVLPLWYAAALPQWRLLIFPTLLILLIQLSREIVKDIEDREGDSHQGARTLPLLIGPGPALAVAAALNLLLWITALLAWWLHFYQLVLPLVVLLGILPLTLYGFQHAWRQSDWRRLQLILKLDMIIGFAALIAGI
ncbi:MAG: geranylgeranylglycerol-phosphate geranylgeranyltransferase [Candidatus Delongbacteria bacterium]|nr:geranylgeranylglycerol-phosphate geranylgeranyltransferase [bacterium]MBL7033057.1 geranylgeranylglycerol-phosphate geranylgeranyltransferase [Candidatus Delongbacteria bacterium]